MRLTIALMTILVFAFAGTAVVAQCPTCPDPCVDPCPKPCPDPCAEPCPTPCPEPCPKPCPEPCPEPCPQVCPDPCCPETALCPPEPQCPCPQATPGALGAGPVPGLLDMECADFDKAYAERMYEQNTAVIALTTQGIQRSTSKNLRDISGEIRTQLTSEDEKLDKWYEQMGCGSIPLNYIRAQTIVDSVEEPRLACFDVAYAKQLIGLLRQSQCAHELAAQKATVPQIRDQAKFAAGYTSDWIFRLERWVCEKGADIK